MCTAFNNIVKDIKLYLIVLSVLIFTGLLQLYQTKVIHTQREKISNLTTNINAYALENSKNKTNYTAFKMTIDDLQLSNDTLMHKLDSMRKQLKIKDKQLKNILYTKTIIHDTITNIVNSEIFKKDTFCLTFISNPNTKITFCRKDSIVTCIPDIENEYYVITSKKKEYVNQHKTFIRRLLKFDFRKHIILKIDVVNTNPDIKIKTNRFVEIIE